MTRRWCIAFDDREMFYATREADLKVMIPVDDPKRQIFEVEAEFMVRPHLIGCLEELTKYYQLIVFTASE